MCSCVNSVFMAFKLILALNCRLQIEQVDSDCTDSDDDPLAVALRFLSASQILFGSY